MAAGDTGVLIDTDIPPSWLAAAVKGAGFDGVIDVVPGARTVLVLTSPGSRSPDELAARIAGLPVTEPPAGPRDIIEIPVVYDGPDLADVASLAGLVAGEVIERHAAALYTVGWLGFAPGFGYLTGLDQRLAAVPRLASPRPSVPAGSVAIAAGLTAVYPSASPGGWRLIGRTTARMWDPYREPAALLAPGQRVRFRPIEPGSAATDSPSVTSPADERAGRAPPPVRRIEVRRTGPLASVQDLGRPGFGASGVPPSGAADRVSLIAGNRLAGNDDGAAGIELTLGRAAFTCFGELTVAVTGAPAEVTLTESPQGRHRPAPFGESFAVPDGGLVAIGAPAAGLRTYVAVGGGLAVPAQLGSRSADLLAGLGGGPLQAGAILPVGQAGSPAPVALAGARGVAGLEVPRAGTAVPGRGEIARLRVVAGPRLDWFGPRAMDVLCGSLYTVTAQSNRTGMRLDGPPLPPREAELPSEGLVTGSLQVPGNGLPILLLADHHTVGGYPVIAVVASADLGLAAQLRPGSQISFARAGT
ncbi:MAG TPA: urea amidolyase family protein [Streptosporangiaceae bacterium]|nr:urea amidolyase family protein [Streptosporangiaceae bacterium]